MIVFKNVEKASKQKDSKAAFKSNMLMYSENSERK